MMRFFKYSQNDTLKTKPHIASGINLERIIVAGG